MSVWVDGCKPCARATAGVYWFGTPRGATVDGIASGGDLPGGER